MCLEKSVLVVDDDENIRLIFSKLLSSAGFKVITASSGEEAVEIIVPSLYAVITDMHMLKLNGNDVARRAKDINKKIITVLCYSPLREEPVHELFDGGINLKPINFGKIISSLY